MIFPDIFFAMVGFFGSFLLLLWEDLWKDMDDFEPTLIIFCFIAPIIGSLLGWIAS